MKRRVSPRAGLAIRQLVEQHDHEERVDALAELGLRELPPDAYDDEHRALPDPPDWVGLS